MVLGTVVKECRQAQDISPDEALVRYATHRRLNRKDILDDEAFLKVHVYVIAIAQYRSSRGWRADRRLAYRLNTKARSKIGSQNCCVSTSIDECRH